MILIQDFRVSIKKTPKPLGLYFGLILSKNFGKDYYGKAGILLIANYSFAPSLAALKARLDGALSRLV